jgi:hypothetical protein
MKTIKLSLLFLLIPFMTFGQANCLDNQIQIYIDIWQIGGLEGTYTFEIQSISGVVYVIPYQLSATPNTVIYGC